MESIFQGEFIGATWTYEGLTDEESENVTSLLEHEFAGNTRKNYLSQWRRFEEWAERRKVESCPADPIQVVVYLVERLLTERRSPSTLRASVSAISHVHRLYGRSDPCAMPVVRRTLSAANRQVGWIPVQASPLREDVFGAIREVACEPRIGKGGNLERPETAERRGTLDIAMIGMMRDGLLRVSEAAAANWADVEGRPDGTGRLMIRRSKTDKAGRGFVVFLSRSTMSYLSAIRNGASGSERVIGLRPNQISRRIKRAAMEAGYLEGYSGHSCRVGMACDLAEQGIELPRIMQAGRWESPAMVARYIRNAAAGSNAVAEYYSFRMHLS